MTTDTVGQIQDKYSVVRIATSAWDSEYYVKEVLFQTPNLYEAYQRLLQEEADHPSDLYIGSPIQYKWQIDVKVLLDGAVEKVTINGEVH